MSWRPRDWEKVNHKSPYHDWGSIRFNDGIEIGADAMLRAIKDLVEEEGCGECGYDYHLTIPDIMGEG